ncbi:hypothetical protein Tco_1065552 [Tanacetum coccineum]
MAETMEQYMSKTRADYQSGVARPEIEDKDNFELKGQFLKELRTNTFSDSDHEDANEHIEIVLEIMDLFHIPNITIDQEVVLFYNGLDVPTRKILDSGGAVPWKTTTDAKVAIHKMVEYSQNGTIEHLGLEVPTTPKISHLRKKGKPSKKLPTLNLVHLFKEGDIEKLPRLLLNEQCKPFVPRMKAIYGRNPKQIYGESGKRHEENSNLIKEIRDSTNAAIRNQGASIKTLEIQIGKISKSISTIVKADASLIRRIGSHQYTVSTRQNSTLIYETRQTTIQFPSHLNDCYCEDKKGSYGPQFSEAYSYGASHIDKSIPRKEKDPRSFTLPCYINNVFFDNSLSYLGASVSVMPLSTYLNLVGIGKFVFPIYFITLDMPEDIKVPLILKRPFLSTAHAKIDVFKRKTSLRVGEEKIIFKSVKPTCSLIKRVYMLSLRERMELDLEARLIGETLVLNRSFDPLFEDSIELNDLNVPLELRRDQVDDLMPTIEEGEIVEEFRARNDARMVLGLKDFKMILRITTTQLQLLSDYNYWKVYADRDKIKSLSEKI